MSIRRLPEHLVNRIAAGEVVERPASALKELVENAIDAGATRIAVRLAGGGTDLVEVTDDGCGMTPPDMALALERHATSKLPDEAIEAVSTLGFRGEALPSIASVARLTLESRPRGAEGWARVVDNGVLLSEGPAAIPPGTRVRVEALFERVPARRKFLRSARSEFAACIDVVKRLAMARPDIGFSVEHDGRRSFGVSAGESLPDRVAALTDRGLVDNGVGVDFVREGIGLGGIAGLPTFNRGIADHQYLFVNGRPVKDRLLIGAIRGAYAEMMPRDRHAVVALFLDVPPDAVDIIPDRLENKGHVLGLLRDILKLPPEEMDRLVADLEHAAGFQPVQVAENLDWERFAAVSVRLPELPGVAPTRGFSRSYPAGAAVAHLTGYVGAASAEQYKQTRDPLMVTPGFKLGKDGLEKTLEKTLRGVAGQKRVEVTARGKLVAELATKPDQPGTNARLTIDAGLQEYAARRLGTQSGSVVVIDVATGEMLAMVSMPAYDPNTFSDGISHLEWKMLSDNDHVPLMNKVLQGLYPPGSTVKPMNGLALLGAGVPASDRVVCTGALRVGTGIFHCHKKSGHGALDLKNAIMQSCDIYFYEMIRRLGYDHVAPVARRLGLGQKFDLPFNSQRYGTVPDTAWKLRRYKQPWTVPDSLNASIGQGYVLTNPLQLAVMASRLASGRALQPSILADHVHADAPALPIQPDHLQTIHEAMWGVVNGGGTGGAARMLIPGVQLAGKTGTAQVRRITMAERAGGVLKNGALPFKMRDHALFQGFAPHDKPRYAIAVVLEHGGHTVRNLDTPAIARDIMTYLFDRDRALASLAEAEPTWGGDIKTRMAAETAAYRAAAGAPPLAVGAQTELNATAPTDAPAVRAASAADVAAAEDLANSAAPGNTVAEDGTTERDVP